MYENDRKNIESDNCGNTFGASVCIGPGGKGLFINIWMVTVVMCNMFSISYLHKKGGFNADIGNNPARNNFILFTFGYD